jgi:hypothetical protein
VRTLAGVAESLIGAPITRVAPAVGCISVAIMSRAASCGSASICAMSRTSPLATPAWFSRATHSALVAVRNARSIGGRIAL